MASLLKRERLSDGVRQALNSRDDQQTTLLVDDADTFDDANTNLSLQITSSNFEDKGTPVSPSSAVIPFEGTHAGTGFVTFEVVSAERVKDGRDSYVLYHIALSVERNNESSCGKLEKRYSDFEKLNSSLRKKFSDLMEDVAFPGKLILGNFSDENIAKRSRAFEQYLSHLFTIDAIRYSEELKDFFYGKDLQGGSSKFTKEEFSEAAKCFEKCLPIQERLLGNQHPDVVLVLSALSICYHKTDSGSVALKFAESALSCLGDDYENLFYLPLLKTCIYLCWMLGKDKGHLEGKLAVLKERGHKTENTEDLKSVVMNQYRSKSVWYCDQ